MTTGEPDLATIRSILEKAGSRVTHLEPAGSGRASWTYLADDQWVVQVPRFDNVAESLRVQSELMAVVQAAVPYMVPVPEPFGAYDGQTVLRYRMIPGRPLRPGDRWLDVAPMLRALHDVPVSPVAEILECGTTPEAWRSRHVEFHKALEHALYPRIDDALRRAMSAEYERFLAGAFDFTPRFLHCDLGTDHVLVDPDSTRPTGIIDFDWATVGDPALDFVGLLIDLGPEATHRIIREYGGGISWRRLLFYWWLNPCYELVYAGPYLDEDSVRDGVETIRHRISLLAELQDQAP